MGKVSSATGICNSVLVPVKRIKAPRHARKGGGCVARALGLETEVQDGTNCTQKWWANRAVDDNEDAPHQFLVHAARHLPGV